MAEGNGAANGPRNHFGDRPSEVILPEVADRVMQVIRERHPLVFAAALAEALTGVRLVDQPPRNRTPVKDRAPAARP